MAKNDNDKTKTYAKAENNETVAYSDSDNLKTEIYNSNLPETATYPNLQNKQYKSKTHGIGIGDKLAFRSTEYKVTGIISEATGEAVIYKIEDQNKNTLTLKLYFEFSNSKEEPNFETLKRIKEITDPDILKIYDFGVGADKYQGKYCYEISDFAEGGDLFSVDDFKGKYTTEFIEHNVIPEIFNGIKKLHDYKIYHCDLKPSNIFFKDKSQTDLIIGDYGSAKAYDLESEKELRKSSTIKGTEAYLAPEQARGIISERNDFYSFGVILLHLLYPECIANDSYYDKIDKDKYSRIVERQYNSVAIIDYNPKLKHLNNLIEGLTLINHLNRFGKSEVERWLKGEEVEVKYSATETISVQPVKLGYATIKTDKDFINILETRDSWWEELFEDVDTYFAIKAWIASYRDIVVRKVFDEMIHFYKPLGKEYVKEAAIRFFQPDREIRIDMNSFNFFTSTNIKKDVEIYISKLDNIWKITKVDKLRFYLFQLEFSLRQLNESVSKEHSLIISSLIDKIYSPFGLVQKPFDNYKTQIQSKINQNDTQNAIINLFYIFNSDRKFQDHLNNPYETIEEIAFYFAQNEEKYEDTCLKQELNKFIINFKLNKLNGLRYEDFLFAIFPEQIRSKILIKNLKFNIDNISVSYSLSKSLNDFLSQHKVLKNISKSYINDKISLKTSYLQSSKNIYKKIISAILVKHRLTIDNITKTSMSENYSYCKKEIKTYKKRSFSHALYALFASLFYGLPAIIAIVFGFLYFYSYQNYKIIPVLNFLNIVNGHMDIVSGNTLGLYIYILISLIPGILFSMYEVDKNNTYYYNKSFDADTSPHKLAWYLILYTFISFIVTLILFVILEIVIGIASIFGNFKTDPTVASIMSFLIVVSIIPVLVFSFSPIYTFLKENGNKISGLINRYLFEISVIVLLIVFPLIYYYVINVFG